MNNILLIFSSYLLEFDSNRIRVSLKGECRTSDFVFLCNGFIYRNNFLVLKTAENKRNI